MEWRDYHMGFAKHAALKSKDSTQVGAVAVGKDKQIIETGFNGPPRGVQDLPERRERPAKYLYTAHAEANLVATAARERLLGATVYVTHMCCHSCAKSLIQAGVSKVIVGDGTTSMPEEEFEAAKVMFAEAGVELATYGKPAPEEPMSERNRAEANLLQILGVDKLLKENGLSAKDLKVHLTAGQYPTAEVEVYRKRNYPLDPPTYNETETKQVKLTPKLDGTYQAMLEGENK